MYFRKMKAKRIISFVVLFVFLSVLPTRASQVLIPMDDSQAEHLKSYGIAYWLLQNGGTLEWLLNYRGGSFLCPNLPSLTKECTIRGVSFEVIADAQAQQIFSQIADPEVNACPRKKFGWLTTPTATISNILAWVNLPAWERRWQSVMSFPGLFGKLFKCTHTYYTTHTNYWPGQAH